jgi:hypothetical protein
MKRLFTILAAAVALSGCAGLDIGALGDSAVRVTETLTDENTSTARGVTAGMSSSDAANTIMNREYYATIRAIATSMKPIVEIEARDGEPITINAKSFKVYSPSAMAGGGGFSLAPPKPIESTGLKIAREVRDTLASVFVPWYSIQKTSEVQRLQITTNAETTRFVTSENNGLMRDLVGTQPDPASLDRANADRIRIEAQAEADRARLQPPAQ